MKVVGVDEAITLLKKGLPIIFQTDTLPAIGCLPEYSEIIYEVKKRDKNKPLILMGSEINQITSYVHQKAKGDFIKLAEKFWPGPITLIIPIADQKKDVITSNDNSLGIRIPNSSIAQKIIFYTGPLVTSSANLSGVSTSISEKEVSTDFPNINILGPIPWEKCSGKASTIVSWNGNGNWKAIREGEIAFNEI
tara:strand:+ start:1204 stop:1782 length:579 start_codon:yes stop_codon:yes gene_type:complete